MSAENLHRIPLSESELRMETYLEDFEQEYPDMLVHVVPASVVLKEMLAGENNEV